MEELHGPIAYGVIVLISIFMIMIVFFSPSKEKEPNKCVENFLKAPSNFLMFNYFPRHKIQVEAITQKQIAVETDGSPVFVEETNSLVGSIDPLKTEGLTKDKVNKYLAPGTLLRFYVVDPRGRKEHYSDYVVNTRENERIKNLHIGMITTRFMANTTDSLHTTSTAGNAGSGSAWLVIHNTTNIPLILNDGEIKVEPHSTFRYLGYLNQGVTLGTYFKDTSGLYPDYQILQPYTDLYYGIVSDLQQPLNGCLQYEEFNDQCNYGDTLWPFVDGVY
jgi:hypothetical protein